jgi:hypothetical protein
MGKGPDPIRNWHEVAVELLVNDVDCALLLMASLFGGEDGETVACTVRIARSAYDNILLQQRQTQLTSRDAATLSLKLEQLRSRLRFFGERI